MNRFLIAVACAMLSLSLLGCEKKEPTVGESLQNAADKAGEAASEAGAAVEKAAEDAANEADKATE